MEQLKTQILQEFENIYLEYVESEIERGQKAIKGLKENNYLQIMDKEVKKRGIMYRCKAFKKWI